MQKLGKILKENREKKILTIQEVAQITKIKEIYIDALEKELINNLPQRVYTIGFIQNLATLYQIDSDQLIVAYDILLSNFSKIKKNNEFNMFSKDNYIEKNKLSNENFNLKDEKKEKINNFFEEDNTTNIAELEINNIDKKYSDEEVKIVSDKIIQDKELLKMKNQVEKKAEKAVEKDFPTAKLVLEFESLMKEEEKTQTQKIKKQLLEENIKKTRFIKKTFFNKDNVSAKGPTIMLISLLFVAFFLLIYIIITALLK